MVMNLFTIVLVVFAFLFTGTHASAQVNIGILGDFSGPNQRSTNDVYKSAQFTIKTINLAGGTRHGRIEVYTGDSGCTDPVMATASAERFVTKQRVHAILVGLVR